MKTKLFFLVLFSVFASAQKSAPVAGDAATLLDLFAKDYTNLNPDTIEDELVKDRAKVIGIFKSYLLQKIDSKITYDKDKDLETLRINYLKEKEHLEILLKKSELSPNYITEINELKLAKNKKIYFNTLYRNDNTQLDDLANAYESINNQYVGLVIRDFMKKYDAINKGIIDSFSRNNNALSYQKGLLFSGGDILVDAIDGLSRFLAKRLKEELTLNAINKIQEYLNNPDKHEYLHELSVVLPTTVNYLKSFNADQLLSFSDDIKQYIEDDVNHLVENAVNLKNTPKFSQLIKNNPDLDFAFEGLEIMKQVSKIKNPVDYFEILENSRNLNRWRNETNPKPIKFKIAQSLRMATMLAYSMTLVENGEVKFITTDFISNYGSQKTFYYLYFGFLHQQNENYFKIKFTKNDALSLKELVNTNNESDNAFSFIKSQVVPIINNAEKIHAELLAIKKVNKNEEKLDYKQMHELIADIISFAEEIMTSGQWLVDSEVIKSKESSNFFSGTKPYFSVARTANDIVLDLHNKKYTNAITKAIEIPLNLRVSDRKTVNFIDKIKDLNSNYEKIAVITKLMNASNQLTNANAVNKSKEIKLFHNDLLILKLRLENQKNAFLKPVVESLDLLMEEIDGSPINVLNYNTNLANLKEVVKNNKNLLLDYLGLDFTTTRAEIHRQLMERKIPTAVSSVLLEKYDELIDQSFDYYVLEEEGIDLQIKHSEIEALYNEFLPQLLEYKSIKDKTQLVKFIHFVNDIAIAEGPEAYEKAIEAFALPVGSSSQKETALHYYSINAFPGLLGGWEKSDGQEDAEFIGFTAPVGFYIQPWPSFKKGCNIGLFVPIIDIAAPVRLRLDSSNKTQTLPDFELVDIFSPGVYAIIGLRKSPISFNIGFQYGPKLRDIPIGTTGEFTSVESYRIGIGATVDIPLVRLASKFKD